MAIDNLYSVIDYLLNPWIIIGFFGQFLFFMRFIVQWWASEKRKQVVVPKAFWYLSTAGTLVILAYSVHIKDIVFIIAQVLSLGIYARNLSFERRMALQRATVNADSSEPA
jgi:lipid-A-disaccharide synthase-like uncharacterized protein